MASPEDADDVARSATSLGEEHEGVVEDVGDLPDELLGSSGAVHVSRVEEANTGLVRALQDATTQPGRIGESARKLAELMGGQLAVHSRVGAGRRVRGAQSAARSPAREGRAPVSRPGPCLP